MNDLDYALRDPERAIAAMALCFAENPIPLFAFGIRELLEENQMGVDDLYRLSPSPQAFRDILDAWDRPLIVAEPARLRVVH